MTGKEEETTAVQDVKPTSEQKVEKQTTQKVEPTYTQKQYDEGVGKGSASINRQLSVSKAETQAAKAKEDSVAAELAAYRTATEEDIRSLQTEHESLIAERFEDAGERRSYLAGQRDKRTATERERKVAKREADVEAKSLVNERSAVEVFMNRKIDQVVRETGITREDLMGCMSEAEVELMGLRFQIAKPKEPVVETETPQFETGASSGGGGKGKTPTLEELKASTPWDTQKKVDAGEWKF